MPRLTESLIDDFAALRAEGVPIKDACKQLGVSTKTFYRWKARAEAGDNGLVADFAERVLKHRKQGRLAVATPTHDWRSIDHFQSWVAGECGCDTAVGGALILDSGDKWEPEPWQLAPIEDILADLYQAVWLVVPEGCGKTTLTAGVDLYLLEHQITPEIPIGSATVTQAETLFRQIEGFIVRSDKLKGFNLAPGLKRIDCRATMGHTRVYPHNERSGDGVIPSASVLDEGHLHPDLRLYRTWKGKYRKRRGPVIVISTAGEPASEFEDLRKKLLNDATEVETNGPHIRAVHQNTVLHDWAVRNREQVEDMEVVAAANPLGVITAAELAEKYAEPEMTPEHWLRRTCNIAARAEGAAITQEQWDALFEPNAKGKPDSWRVAWVDFGWQVDTTAMGILAWDSFDRRVIEGVRIFEPPVDEEDVVAGMVEIQQEFSPVGWVYDPAASGQMMAQQLDKSQHPLQGDVRFQMLKHKNNAPEMAIAAARFDEALRTGRLVHDGHEGLRRHALNAIKKQAGGEKWRYDRPDDAKGERRKKFPTDALIGVVMGHSHAVVVHDRPAEPIAIWGSPR